MGPEADAARPGVLDGSLRSLLDSHWAADLNRRLEGLFGDSARLYATDHELRNLVAVTVDDETDRDVTLEGELRRAVLATEAVTVGDATWIPLPEGDHPVFVVRVDGDGDASTDIDPRLLGAALRSHRSRFEDLERRRRRRTMSAAAELQWNLLPPQAQHLGSHAVAGVLEPAYDIAGDLFDYAAFDGAIWVYILDAMSHGMPATLLGVTALAALRTTRRSGAPLEDQFAAANKELFELYGGGQFVTCLALRIDDQGVTAVNAGHETARRVVDGRVGALNLEVDLPFGVDGDTEYLVQSIEPAAPGDGFVLLSDGPALSRSQSGERYGDVRIDEQIATNWGPVALATAHDLMTDVIEHTGDAGVEDDLTVVVVHNDRSPIG